MASPGLAASVAVVALALLGVAVGVAGALELSQPTTSTTTTYSSYMTSLVPVLNVSLLPNGLFQAGNVTNPSAIYANITRSLSFSVWYDFESSELMAANGVLSTEATFSSGTSPSWSTEVESASVPLTFDSVSQSVWVGIPLNLSAMLTTSAVIDQELGLLPGAGTLLINVSASLSIPGAVVENSSSIALSFEYSTQAGGSLVPSAYSAIDVVPPVPGVNSGEISTETTTQLPSKTGLGEEYLIAAEGMLAAGVVVGVVYLPRHKRPTAVQRFLAENAENVVRVRADTRPSGKAVEVADVGELVKLANLSGQPIYLFESSKGILLYAIQGETTFALSVPLEPDRDRRVS